MFTKRLAGLSLTVLLSACAIADEADEKLSVLARVQTVYAALVDLAAMCNRGECGSRASPDEALINQKVAKIVKAVQDPQVLWKLSIVTYTSAFPQDAGVQRVDLVFNSAWRESIRKLCSGEVSDSLDALQSVQQILRTDASNSLLLNNCTEKLLERSKAGGQ